MKDITDYFTSPTKIQKSKEGPEEPKVVEKSPNQNVNNQNEDKVGEKSDINKQENKKTKRKRRRKPTDPEVKNVTDLFSSNLKLKSPIAGAPSSSDKSPLQESQKRSNTRNTEVSNTEDVCEPKKEENELVVEESDLQTDTPKPEPKVNAFQFLMSNRNNIIGLNSNGKTKDEDVMVIEPKEKLDARKNLFQKWAEQKGATKRKREDEEIEKCIDIKMEERTKRLKNMLTSGQIEEKSPITKSKRKVFKKQRIKKLSSSNSEDSNDPNQKESVENPMLQKLTEVLEDSDQDITIPNSSQSPKNNLKEQNKHNNLLSFIGFIAKDKEEQLEVFEDSPSKQSTKEFIKIKMFTPQAVKKKRSSLSLKKPQAVDPQLSESSQESVKSRKHKKKKKHKVINEDSQNGTVNKEIKNEELILHDLSSDFASPKIENVQKDPEPNFKDEKQPANGASQGRVLRKRSTVNYSDLFKAETYKETSKTSSSKKSKISNHKDESIEKIELSSDSDDEEASVKKSKTPLKVAPVFLKATPQPKLDPETVEARKKFLLSGIPESLKKTIEKQKSIEEKDFDSFPRISHVQQKCHSLYWNLPRPELKLTEKILLKITKDMMVCHNVISRQPRYAANFNKCQIKKSDNIKTELDKIKQENADYPVYKVFRHIFEKSGKKQIKETGKARKSPRKKGKNKSNCSSESTKSIETYEMWTEKYKPRCSEEILGNHQGVAALKKFLETWMHYSEEINARGKRKRQNSNSESEFESTDCDSRDSIRLPGNTIVLAGAAGSGKTNAVYAIASELGFNILELNASSKRTGKRLIQELQEATQSHQVRKTNQEQSMANFINSSQSKSKQVKDPEDKDLKKMCILLVEDIDLVFDQDEGFLSSLAQLVTTSKRPIVMTTTDTSPPHVQKFMSQHECISFTPLSLHCLGVWLQVVCLVEGLLVDKNDVGNLLEYNKGDIRKTLLEVQFWAQSGGHLERNRKFPFTSVGNVCSFVNNKFKSPDEELRIALKNVDTSKEDLVVHRHCLGSFVVCRGNEEYNLPKQFDLGCIWWNMPNILSAPSFAGERLNRTNKQKAETECHSIDKAKLKLVGDIYDTLVLSDCLLATVGYSNTGEPIVRAWETEIRESLELNEREEGKDVFLDPVSDLVHNMLDRRIDFYRKSQDTECHINLALPDLEEQRWRANQHMCENFLKEPIPTCNILDRKSVALDYLPALRHIARLEDKRAASNTKRGNRFRHYMKNLNMAFKESTCKMACNILFPNED